MYRKLYRTCRQLFKLRCIFFSVIISGCMLAVLHFNKNPDSHRRNVGDKVERMPMFDSLTIIIREYEDFDNRLHKTALATQGAGIPLLIIAEDPPYPPVNLPNNSKIVIINKPPSAHAWSYNQSIHTSHVAIVPDGCYVSKVESLFSMISHLKAQDDDVRMIAGRCAKHSKKGLLDESSYCQGLNVDLKKWTLTYFNSSSEKCNSLLGTHILVIAAKDILSLPYPFARPVSTALYIQSSLRKWKTVIYDGGHFIMDGSLYKDPHKQWKHQFKESERIDSLYKLFGIKLVKSVNGKEQYYGCTKDSARCFGTVVNDMPEYLYKDKWTPPCCLKALRITARYVFKLLQSQEVRYWLEGGSLLGAARNGDIIPWDYDVDVGIYRDDIAKSFHLTQCAKGAFVDDDGFVWEKSRKSEGDFYRVQYSETNHLHVDIFPFYSKHRIMTKDTWMKSHRQDTEFPEHYLKPRTTINFIGMHVSAPNNWKQFLEYKFGKGVIENPRYPDPRIDVVS